MARREIFPESLTELSREALIERALDLQQRLRQIRGAVGRSAGADR